MSKKKANRATNKKPAARSGKRSKSAKKVGMAGVLLVALLAAGYLLWPYLTPAPEVVYPSATSQLDPAVAALVDVLTEQAAADPRNAAVHGELGMAYEANGLWPEAARSYQHAAKLDNKDINWQLHRAVAERQAGNFEDALALLASLARKNPGSAVIQNHYGEALLEAGNLEQAEKTFRTLVQLSPGNAQGYVGLGDIMIQQGAGTEAVQVLEQAVSLNPGYKQAHYLLGRAYNMVGREVEAAAALARGVEAKIQYLPDALSQKIASHTVNVSGRISQASAMMNAGNAQQAARLLEESYIYHNTDVMLLNTLASAYLKTRRLDDAHRLLNRARDLDADQFFTYLNLYTWALRSGDSETALAYADEAITRAPDRDDTHLARAQALTELGRLPEALESATRAMEIDGNKAGNHGLVADINARLGNLDQAGQHFETALELDANLLPALVGLANIRIQQTNPGTARELLQRAQQIAPNHPRVQQLANQLQNLR